MSEKKEKKRAWYTLATNCKPIPVPRNAPGVESWPWATTWKEPKEKGARKMLSECMIDSRYQIASAQTNLATIDFYFNYLEQAAYRANNAGMGENMKPINKYMKKYLEYGYIPVIHLPSFADNIWKPKLKQRLEALHIPHISISAAPITGSARLGMQDYIAYRGDISRALKDYLPIIIKNIGNIPFQSEEERNYYQNVVKNHEEFLNSKACDPENLRLADTARRLYQL